MVAALRRPAPCGDSCARAAANDDRRGTADALVTLEQLIERMEMLGHDAEDAAARITRALGGNLKATTDPDQQQLLSAIGDVIES